MRKAIFAWVMVCFWGCANVFGFAGGDGSVGDPWQISTRADLEAVNNDLAAHYVLINDIDLSGHTYYTSVIAMDSDPITSDFQGTAFDGSFNGAGHMISGLTISAGYKNYIGLFGSTGIYSNIKQLGLTDVNIIGDDIVGGLVGECYGRIYYCNSNGLIVGDYSVGGLVGSNNNGIISNSFSTGNVDASHHCGGLIGSDIEGAIENCYSTVNLDGESSNYNVGGLLGSTQRGIIRYCFSVGTVTGFENIGGLVGSTFDGVITSSYASGVVNGTYSVGGLVGGHSGIIVNCYSAVSEIVGFVRVGGLFGYSNFGTAENCFWDVQTSLINDPEAGMEDTDGMVGMSTDQMQTLETFTDAGWDFTNYASGNVGDWGMIDGYPILWYQDPGVKQAPDVTGITLDKARAALQAAGFTVGGVIYIDSMTVIQGMAVNLSIGQHTLYTYENIPTDAIDIYVSTGVGGDGSVNEPYRISNKADLDAVNYALSANYILVRDIDLDGYEYPKAIIAWDADNSHGFQDKMFTGNFDGNNKKISNMTIEGGRNCSLGLFAYVGGINGKVCDLELLNSRVISEELAPYSGILVGMVDTGATIEKCRVAGGYIKGNGGLVYGNRGTINNCHAVDIYVECLYGSGLLHVNFGNITNCSSMGTIVCSRYSGGLCGVNKGSIGNCYSTARIIGPQYSAFKLGGLVGVNDHGAISNCYSAGEVAGGNNSSNIGGFAGSNELGTIENSYSTGKITGGVGLQDVGGFCGYSSGTFDSCFWNIQGSWIADGVGNIEPDPAGVIALTTDEMQRQATFVDAGWEFGYGSTGVWYLPEGNYPRLTFGAVIDGDIAGLYGVNFSDYAYVANYWGLTDCDGVDDCGRADIDDSGEVGLGDIAKLAANWLMGVAVTVLPEADDSQKPYSGNAILLPGVVEAEDYDIGGQGVSYFDTTQGNEVGFYRDDDVDIANRDGGFNLAWTDDGEWLEYTVDVVGGVYDMQGRFATTEAGKQLRVLLDGVELGVFDVPVTGDWGVFETVTIGGVSLPDGDGQVLRLEIIGGMFNLNWISFEMP